MNDYLHFDFEKLPLSLDNNEIDVSGLCDKFDITEQSLREGNFDISVMKKKFLPVSYDLPLEYLDAAGTFLDSIKGICDYLEFSFNSQVRKSLLAEIELTESIIRFGDGLVNANALLRIGQYFSTLNLGAQDMCNMASFFNMKLSKRKAIYEVVKECRSDYEVATLICKMANNNYEKNFRYSIRKLSDKFIVIGKSNSEIHDILKIKNIVDDTLIYFKAYTIANTSTIVFGKPMNLVDISSYTSGGHQYHVFVFKENWTMLFS